MAVLAKGVTIRGSEVGGMKNGPLASMNVIPLMDILLVLVIIFMVITPLALKGLQAVIPQSTLLHHKQEMHHAKHWLGGLPYHDLETL
jgi:biopolymer transport protein ExbD